MSIYISFLSSTVSAVVAPLAVLRSFPRASALSRDCVSSSSARETFCSEKAWIQDGGSHQ